MRKFLVTMAGNEQGFNEWNLYNVHRDYDREAERLFNSAEQYVDDMKSYDNNMILSSKYYEASKKVLDMPQFAGAFKAIILKDALERMDDGDVVFWSDSNHVFINNAQPLIDFSVNNNMFIHTTTNVYYPNKDWTFRDMFVGMGCDEERYWNAPQMQVSVMCFCKTPFTVQFIDELLKYSLDYDVMVGNHKYPDFPSFRGHRREQSVISIMVEKYKIPYQKEPTQYVPELDPINVYSLYKSV